MPELLSPAGSPEAVIACVQNGADSIYLGFGSFNARRGAKNFTDSEFKEAMRYCLIRGVKVYVALNTLIGDGEISEAVRLALYARDAGAGAIILQDIGLARCLREVMPDMPLHADARIGVHSLAGAEAAHEIGFKRVTLARELTFEQIGHIAARARCELEVFAHGASCVCLSGQCYLSAMAGQGSASRGLCAGLCRSRYSMGGRMDEYPLSLKDLCLAEHLEKLGTIGVQSIKIEGRPRRPEYGAIVTGIYSRALRQSQSPGEMELSQLLDISLSDSFSDGYVTGERGEDMFGKVSIGSRRDPECFAPARRAYSGAEARRVPVTFYALAQKGEAFKLAVTDPDDNRETLVGAVPQLATKQATTERLLQEQIYKTGGTPYYCDQIRTYVDPGLYVMPGVVDNMRHMLLERLSEKRKTPPSRPPAGAIPRIPHGKSQAGAPKLIVQVASISQLTAELAALSPNMLYVPLTELDGHSDEIAPFIDNGCGVAAILPRMIRDSETTELRRALERVRLGGVSDALVSNLGHIRLARTMGFETRADFGMNIYNSHALKILDDAGFISCTASFEMKLSEVSDLAKVIDTELIVYGRVPVMVTDLCVIKCSSGRCSCQSPAGLTGSGGMVFPIMREFGCRNLIYSSHKLYLADKREQYENIGLWGQRLIFSTESARECVSVTGAYLGLTSYKPNGLTRGLYLRGAE